MRADLEGRLACAVTVLHRPDQDADEWVAQRVARAMWVEAAGANVATDGIVEAAPSLVVQVPEDQGAVEAAPGDWVVRGEAGEGVLTTSEVRALVSASGGRHVTRCRDARGSLSGCVGPALRYASSLILECG